MYQMNWISYVSPTIAALTFAGTILAVVWRKLWSFRNKITAIEKEVALLKMQGGEHASQLMVLHDGIRDLQNITRALHSRYDKAARLVRREKRENRERIDQVNVGIEILRRENNARFDETNKLLQMLIEKHIKSQGND